MLQKEKRSLRAGTDGFTWRGAFRKRSKQSSWLWNQSPLSSSFDFLFFLLFRKQKQEQHGHWNRNFIFPCPPSLSLRRRQRQPPFADLFHRTFMASSVSCRNLIRRLSALSSTTSSLRGLSSSSFAAAAASSSASSSSSHSPLLRHPPPRTHGPRTLVPASVRRVSFTSSASPPPDVAESPTTIDYSSLLQEDEFHRLADETIHDLQERLEEYSDDVQIDGFDIDYGNQVLTLKFGALGTYVINKQTPNRQIWLSSPVSGPSRFDWDRTSEAWLYRRTKANLLRLLEDEVAQLCGKPISLS